MPEIIKDQEKIEEILSRGVECIYPDRETLAKLLLSGKRIRLYGGFDPSAASLHIGNAILINKLAQFQALGHEVIFLIGDFTGMIGDPTDKAATRQKLSRAEVRVNSASFVQQASVYLRFDGDNPARVVYNSEWSDKLTFPDLIELTSHFTVQQMLQRDMFQRRLSESKPIHLHEFLYPLAQGYDSAVLDVDLEVGGNDQMFNMMCGRHLQSALGKKDKCVMNLRLLTDDKGKKMGKSEGNAVFLDQAPNDIYGAIMSWPDEAIVPALELATKLTWAETKDIEHALGAGLLHPRDAKMRLAREMVILVHGSDAGKAAEEYFVSTFQKKEIPEEMPEIKLPLGTHSLIDLLVDTSLVSSRGEARRQIAQGAIKVDSVKVCDECSSLILTDSPIVLQKGKRHFVKIIPV